MPQPCLNQERSVTKCYLIKAFIYIKGIKVIISILRDFIRNDVRLNKKKHQSLQVVYLE